MDERSGRRFVLHRSVACALAGLVCACGPGLTEIIRRATIVATPSKPEYARADTISITLRNDSGEPVEVVVSHCPVSLEVATNDDGWGTAESSPATICPPDVSLILSIVTVLSGEEKVVLAYPIRSWMPNGTYRARVSVYLPRDGSSRTVTSPTFGLVAPEP